MEFDEPERKLNGLEDQFLERKMTCLSLKSGKDFLWNLNLYRFQKESLSSHQGGDSLKQRYQKGIERYKVLLENDKL